MLAAVMNSILIKEHPEGLLTTEQQLFSKDLKCIFRKIFGFGKQKFVMNTNEYYRI